MKEWTEPNVLGTFVNCNLCFLFSFSLSRSSSHTAAYLFPFLLISLFCFIRISLLLLQMVRQIGRAQLDDKFQLSTFCIDLQNGCRFSHYIFVLVQCFLSILTLYKYWENKKLVQSSSVTHSQALLIIGIMVQPCISRLQHLVIAATEDPCSVHTC